MKLEQLKAGAIFMLKGGILPLRFDSLNYIIEYYDTKLGWFWYANVIYFGTLSIKIKRLKDCEDITYQSLGIIDAK